MFEFALFYLLLKFKMIFMVLNLIADLWFCVKEKCLQEANERIVMVGIQSLKKIDKKNRLYTHSYCLREVFLTFTVAQHAADIEIGWVLATARFLQ